jgi:hypothetical protein
MGYLLSCSDHALQWSEGADSFQCSWKGSCQQYKGLEIVSAVLALYSKPSTSGTPLVKIHIDQGSSTDAEAGQPYSFHLLHCHHPTGKKNPGLRVLGFRLPVPSCCLLLLPPLPKSQPQHNEHILNTQMLSFDTNFPDYRYWVPVNEHSEPGNFDTFHTSWYYAPPYFLRKVKGFSCVPGQQNCSQ